MNDNTKPQGEAEPSQGDANATPNEYEARVQAKKARFLARAAAAKSESASTYAKARGMAAVIPFGQPVHVGHHSESADRNFRDKIHRTFGKSFAALDKAEHYAQKAAAVGTGGISSDDPAALAKLKAELAALEQAQETMKAANKVLRTNKTPETRAGALVALGYSEDQAVRLLGSNVNRTVGYPSYKLSNNNANMARIRLRIAELEKRQARGDVEQVGKGFTYREDTAENRVMFVFEGKPAENVRAVLKRHAFKWSPSRGAWVRLLTNSGIWAAREVRQALEAQG